MNYNDYLGYFGERNSEANAAQTPAYIFDAEALRSRAGFIRSMTNGKARLIYAIKANPFLVPYLADVVDAFEICSPGEERICERYGIPASMMVLSGVDKQDTDFERAFHYADKQAGLPVCTVESLSQLEMLNRTVRSEILLRVTSGNQFGLDPEDVVKIIRERDLYPNLDIIGLQLYTGTQKSRKKVIEREVRNIDALISRIKAECGFVVREFEYGPGLPVRYFLDSEPVDDAEVLGHVMQCIDEMAFKGTVSLEMGRFLAASCGSYVTRIVDIKHSRGVHYAIVDGGIHQLNYYGQMMAMKYPFMQMKNGAAEVLCGPDNSENAAESEKYEICGSLCTVSDVLIRQLPLANPKTGDILVFERTGAYSVTEGISLFLSRDLPRIYVKDGTHLMEIRKQIQTEDFNYGRTY
ncbi:MAG: alanine racemase [Lachnospiraceae bacterium]|nr:alanine racemase [Lachnospiraceae bacterium]